MEARSRPSPDVRGVNARNRAGVFSLNAQRWPVWDIVEAAPLRGGPAKRTMSRKSSMPPSVGRSDRNADPVGIPVSLSYQQLYG